MKINKDYFSLTSKFGRIRYFVSQGNVLSHIIDRIKWHWFPKLHITPDFPTHVDIEISSLCQMKCPMCTQRLVDKKKLGVIKFSLYKKIIDECAKRGVYSIKLSWRGEPSLNPNIFKMIKYAKERGIKDVAFLTNIERFDDKMIKELVKSDIDWISVSFDGLGETYERIRYPAKFEESVEKIKKIVALRKKLGKNKPLVRIQTIFSAIKDNPQEYRDFWLPIVDRINFIADEVRSEKNKTFIRDPNYICPSPWQRMTIAHDGTVAQCYTDYHLKNPLGNVNEKSLYNIWHDKPFKELRKLQKTKKRLLLLTCQECCSGGMMKETFIKIDGKKIKILKYEGQELDIKKMDARKHEKNKDRK